MIATCFTVADCPEVEPPEIGPPEIGPTVLNERRSVMTDPLNNINLFQYHNLTFRTSKVARRFGVSARGQFA